MSGKLPIPKDILRKIKAIEIRTKRLMSNCLIGDSRSAQKGTGLEFDQIREYQVGDDVRYIDWHASARTNNLLVKQYMQERGRVIFLVVDISGSSFFTSTDSKKHELMGIIVSILSLVAHGAKDKVGLLLFTDTIEQYFAPSSSKMHIYALMKAVFEYKAKSKKTNIGVALEYILKLKKKNSLVFLLSDFIDNLTSCDKYFAAVARLYDLIAIRCLDKNEQFLPSIGFVTSEDIETGKELTLDLRMKKQSNVNALLQERIETQNKLFKKYGVDYLDVTDKNSCIADIVRLFHRRTYY